MSTYLVHKTYHRQLELSELGTALAEGRGLLLVDAEGEPRYVSSPLSMGKATEAELRTKWEEACAEGRVHLVWATRWSNEDELPALPVPEEEVEPQMEQVGADEAARKLASALGSGPRMDTDEHG